MALVKTKQGVGIIHRSIDEPQIKDILSGHSQYNGNIVEFIIIILRALWAGAFLSD